MEIHLSSSSSSAVSPVIRITPHNMISYSSPSFFQPSSIPKLPNPQSLFPHPTLLSQKSNPPKNITSKSQGINKLLILPIRQIQPLLILQFHISRSRSPGCFAAILQSTVPPDEAEVDEAGGPADDDGDFGGDVAWCVFGAEGLWA